MTLAFSGLSLVSMIISGGVSYYFTSNIIEDLTTEDLSRQISSVESAIQVASSENTDRQKHLLENWSKRIMPKLEVRTSETEKRTAENQATNQKFETQVPTLYTEKRKLNGHDLVDTIADQTASGATLFVKVAEGFYRVSTSVKKADGNRNIGTLIPNDSEVAKTLMNKERYLGRANVAGNWFVTAYDPIVQNGETVGAFFLGTPETSSEKIRAYLRAQKLLQTGYFYILDPKGTFMLHPAKEGQNVIETTDLDGKFIFKEIIAKKSGIIRYRWLNAETKKSQDKIAIFKYFPEVDWYVAASLNEAEALAMLTELRWTLFIIGALMTGLMAIGTLLLGRYVSKTLLTASSELGSASQRVDDNSAELTGAAEALAQASIQQAASLQETASALEEIRATVVRNLEATEATEKISSEMAIGAQDGQRVLVELNERVHKIAQANEMMRAEIKTSHTQIGRISSVISGIDEKTKVINEIVFQTKLLSFNASVEAARAGEHGRGFSIVAEEVGRLAALSGQAAIEIQSSLSRSRSEVEEIIRTAQERTESVITQSKAEIEAGLEVSQRCSEAFEGILTQVRDANVGIQGISVASKEQSQGIEEINHAVVQMDQVTQQNSATAQQVKTLAEELRENSGRMNASVGNLQIFVHGSKNADEQLVPNSSGEGLSSNQDRSTFKAAA